MLMFGLSSDYALLEADLTDPPLNAEQACTGYEMNLEFLSGCIHETWLLYLQ